MPAKAQTTVESLPVAEARMDAAWSATDLAGDPHVAPDKAARVQRMFGAIAERYDLNNRLHSFWRDQAWRRAAVKLAQVKPTDEVLDVACGTGDLTLAFAANKPSPRSVTGLDFTPEMLVIAREKTQKRMGASGPRRGRAPTALRPDFLQGDAVNLPFTDQSFDIVSIAFGIRNVAEPHRALKEFRRVLRPGGRLLVLEFSKPGNGLIRWFNDLYTGRIMPWTASFIARDRSGAYRYLPKSVATFPEGRDFMNLLSQTGFAHVEAHPMTFGVCTAYRAMVEE